MGIRTSVFALIGVVAVAGPAWARVPLAVFPVENRGAPLSAGAVEVLGGRLARGLEGAFDLLARDVVAASVRAKSAELQRPCAADSCLLAAARDAGAGKAVLSVLMRLGDRCVAIGTLYDVYTGATDATASGEAACDLDGLEVAVKLVADRLSGRAVGATAAPADAKPNCPAVCQRFALAFPESGEAREPARKQCLSRCGGGDVRFAVCAWKARDEAAARGCLGSAEAAAAPAVPPVPSPAATAPAAAGATGSRPNCEAVCGRFLQAVEGSDDLRRPIGDRCRERCNAGDLKFSVCAWRARSGAEAAACLALPAGEPGLN